MVFIQLRMHFFRITNADIQGWQIANPLELGVVKRQPPPKPFFVVAAATV